MQQSISIRVGVPLMREYMIERNARRAILALILIGAMSYAYFVSASVLHIIARKEATAQAAVLESEVAELEAQYSSLAKEVEVQSAQHIGLVPTERKDFVTRTVLQAHAGGTLYNEI